MEYFINLKLLSNPLNWLSISAMILIVAFATIVIQTRLRNASNGPIMPDTGSTVNAQSET